MRAAIVISLVIASTPRLEAEKRFEGPGFSAAAPGWQVVSSTDTELALRKGTDLVLTFQKFSITPSQASAMTDAAKCKVLGGEMASSLKLDNPASVIQKGAPPICETSGTRAGQPLVLMFVKHGDAVVFSACGALSTKFKDWVAECRTIVRSVRLEKAKPASNSAVTVTNTDAGTLVKAPQLSFTFPVGWKVSPNTEGDALASAATASARMTVTRDQKAFETGSDANCKKLGESLAKLVNGQADPRTHKLPAGTACVVFVSHTAGSEMVTLLAGPGGKGQLRISMHADASDTSAIKDYATVVRSIAFN